MSVPSQAKKRRNSNASSDNSRDSRGSRVSRRTGKNAVKENPREALENQVKNNKYVNFANEEQFDAGNVASVQRSFMLTNNDRHQLELQHMKPLQSGGGFGGNSQNYDVVGLMAKKIEYFNIKVRGDADKKLPQGQILIQKTEQDGIFIDAPLEFKNKDVNVQKLEERILNTYNANKGPVELCRAEIYFEPNGEIKLKNDLLAAELTRPADLAFEQTDAF